MDCFGVLVAQFQWLANEIQANVMWTTVTDICPISFFTILWLLPIFLLIYSLVSSPMSELYIFFGLFAHIYRHFYGLGNTSTDDKAWDTFKNAFALCLHYCGRIYHGYEVEGLENIPREGPALFVAYHGPWFHDLMFMAIEAYFHRKRNVRAVVHRAFCKIPGLSLILEVGKVCKGSTETCTKLLKDGHVLLIAPGGTYEALFADQNYQLLWRNHLGYARVAIEAKSPIIPVFTVNCRESYRSFNIGTDWRKMLYEKWSIPLVLFFGSFPVKLRTIIGQPIPFDPILTAEELNRKVMMAMEQLIKDNQRLPGSIAMALMDRFKCQKKLKVT